MTLRFASLGYSSQTGKLGVDGCVAFKRQVRSLLGSVDGAYLMVSPDTEGRKCQVKVAYDAEIPGAMEWKRKAEAVAAEVWETLSERRKEVGV